MNDKSNRESRIWKQYVWLLFFFLSPILSLAHPYYISITEVNYNSKSKNLELSIKCFADDFEKALSEWEGKKFSFERKEQELSQERVEHYVLNQLRMLVDKLELKERFVGYELENDVVFVYLEVKYNKYPKAFDVENQLFIASIPTQENIMHFTVGDFKKSIRLNARNISEQIAPIP